MSNENNLILEPLSSMKLGELLVKRKLIDQKQLVKALAEQRTVNATSKRQFKIGEILVFHRALDLEILKEVLLQQHPRTADQRRDLLGIKKDVEKPIHDPWAKNRSR